MINGRQVGKGYQERRDASTCCGVPQYPDFNLQRGEQPSEGITVKGRGLYPKHLYSSRVLTLHPGDCRDGGAARRRAAGGARPGPALAAPQLRGLGRRQLQPQGP